MLSNEKKQDILNKAPEGATHYGVYDNGAAQYYKDILTGKYDFFNATTLHWAHISGTPLIDYLPLSSIELYSHPNATIKSLAAKTAIVKVMLFDKPCELTACYCKETFVLISAFENKTNQSLMWSEEIKKLIINEIKGQPKANDKIKYKESVGEVSIKMEFTTIDDLLHYLRETKEASEIEEPEVEDPELIASHEMLKLFGDLFKGGNKELSTRSRNCLLPEGIEHKEEWKSIYIHTPKDQQKVQCRIKGRGGYTGNAIYDARTATFRTYEDKENRLIITVWKANEWKAL